MEHGSRFVYVGASDSEEDLSASDVNLMDDLAEEDGDEGDSLFNEPTTTATTSPGEKSGGGFFSFFRRGSSASVSAPAAATSSTSSRSKGKGKGPVSAPIKAKKVKKAKTNIVSIHLNTLEHTTVISTGDAIFCSNCQAGYNIHSVSTPKSKGAGESKDKVEDKGKGKEAVEEGEGGDDTQRIWKCEFCEQVNEIHIANEELPTDETMDYLLEGAPEGGNHEDEAAVVFCIDISGSMCITTEVQGKVALKGDNAKRHAGLNTERVSQRLPNERRDVTYISRLQSVQAAVDASISKIATETPCKRVGIVTFNNEVTLVGDGSKSESQVVTGDKLRNYEELLNFETENEVLSKPVKDTKGLLSKRLFALEEGGATALGPAVVVSVALAAARGPGSRVILCTDGKANVGLGSLDGITTLEDASEVEKWYSQLGAYAASKGVTISVISIRGDDCRMEYLGTLAELTGGQVDIVNPLEVSNEFTNMLSKAVIATNTSITLRLHKDLKVVEGQESGHGSNFVKRDVGNVTSETELTFEYSVVDWKKLREQGVSGLPFQVQISYTRKDGAKIVRIVSQQQNVTTERSKAEAEVKADVMATYVAQTAAKLAQEGEYSRARHLNVANALMFQRSVASPNSDKERVKTVSKWARGQRQLDRDIQTAITSEEMEGGNYSDEDTGELNNLESFKQGVEKKSKRKKNRNDDYSARIYQMKSTSSSAWK